MISAECDTGSQTCLAEDCMWFEGLGHECTCLGKQTPYEAMKPSARWHWRMLLVQHYPARKKSTCDHKGEICTLLKLLQRTAGPLATWAS